MSSKARIYIHIFFLTLIVPISSLCDERYGTYGLFPQGGTRVTAMGGAYAGLSDDIQGINYNPAGLAMGDWWGDVGGNANSVYNQEADLNNDGLGDGVPYTYLYYAAALRVGSTVFGAGVSSPFLINLSFDSPNGAHTEKRTIALEIVSVDLPLAYRLSKNFSIGLTLHSLQMTQRYKFISTDPGAQAIDVSTQKSASMVTVGGIFRSDDETRGIGLSHRPSIFFNVDESLNSQTGGVNWFRDAYIPSRTILGFYYRPYKNLLLVLDIDQYGPSENTVYVGSELVTGFNRVPISSQAATVAHGGLEWWAYGSKMWDVYARAGSYYEPARISGNRSRTHATWGLEVRYWLLVFSVALDTAPGFLNAAGGFGLSLKALF